MTTISRTVPPAPVLPINYAQLYTAQLNVISGQYNKLYEPHLPATGQAEDKLFKMVVSSTNTIPKVLLTRVRLANNTIQIVCLHCLSLYRQDLANPSTKWHNKAIIFMGDIQPGSNFVTTVSFPEMAFAITDAQRVPILANMATHFNNTADNMIGPFNNTIANTKDVHTCAVILVPHCYVHVVFGKEFTPRELWEQVATTIIADGLHIECEHFLTWIRVAATLRTNPADNTIQAPANHVGTFNTTYPHVQDDPFIARHRWETIATNLPALSGKTLPPTNQLVQLFGALHRDQASERAAAEARRLADKLDKVPLATKYKTVAVDWMKICAVSNEVDLPPIYHQLVNADKTEHISILR